MTAAIFKRWNGERALEIGPKKFFLLRLSYKIETNEFTNIPTSTHRCLTNLSQDQNIPSFKDSRFQRFPLFKIPLLKIPHSPVPFLIFPFPSFPVPYFKDGLGKPEEKQILRR